MFKAFPHIASIDIGSNSTILLVAKKEENNLRALVQKIEIYRLGEENLDRLCSILAGFRSLAHSLGAEIKAVAMTEAARKAKNQEELLQIVEEVLWVKPRIISGEQEAELSYKAV
jgi:exopolyphosphatase/guanosine-5'-triphosphate,3'-diphosphate pyrophosphatase